ncbi:unnamed protein product [Spirodela intermedia]|uniref:Uncharacterized protein n=1 Tax=Spirodela intermedia TaxID=51605 RepID=A0A7I8ILQ4_SPIIN|nr:unnamed protein product [Spirodela intermedia]CAA6658356.1 unnamed protein product [Spirodela intermedia]
MEPSCDLEIDVNGKEVFLVDKKILSSFSGKLGKLLSKAAAAAVTRPLRVIFHDLPGGAEAFELLARFCYSHGEVALVTPANACTLHCVAHFMGMAELSSPSSPSLISQTEKTLQGIPFWSWPEILGALKQCQEFLPAATSAGVLGKLLDSLAGRIASPLSAASPSDDSSPESSGFRFSCDTGCSASTKNSGSHHRLWWFEDLSCLNPSAMEKAAAAMVSRKMDHAAISRFLFYYLRVRVSAADATPPEKRKAMDAVVGLLFSLDRCSVTCKGLFGILHICSCLNPSKLCRIRLEKMIASHLDQATLDNLLVPSPLVFFLAGCVSPPRLRRVGDLMDLYLAEVAPDSSLKAEKFASIATVLPDAARVNSDGVYRAVDIFLEVHAAALSEEQRARICGAVDCGKLSPASSRHLAGNSRFPARAAVRPSQRRYPAEDLAGRRRSGGGEREQVVLYARKLEVSEEETEKLRVHLRGMQWRVAELEKLCRRLQGQMRKMTATGGRSRTLPRLCS